QDVPRLRVTTMPPAARRLAAERLRAYADRDCRPENRDTVRCIVEELQSIGEELDTALLREFMLFTNDLDRSRRQSFRSACPELCGLIEAAGFAWTDETLYAASVPNEARV